MGEAVVRPAEEGLVEVPVDLIGPSAVVDVGLPNFVGRADQGNAPGPECTTISFADNREDAPRPRPLDLGLHLRNQLAILDSQLLQVIRPLSILYQPTDGGIEAVLRKSLR
jgi:hypothetical protein